MLLIVCFLSKLIQWLENHFLVCPYKKLLGIDCPGCGMQRAFIELLKGNFWESFKTYPALGTTILLFVFLILHLIFKFNKGAKILIGIFVLNSFIVIFVFIFKLIS